ncbi:unnamed protein product [Ranitomeya imitator]|uniref:Uncharacterized protein n=1 Tax=Ranitomeya imitator TaxID=111125 RepID=A0ABN9MJS7_9NEOB|nr:unnamed protein product [Ranitomeya imitator]
MLCSFDLDPSVNCVMLCFSCDVSDRLEQLERNRERERKQREQQKELKERHRRAEERRKGREARREGSKLNFTFQILTKIKTAREEHGDKNKANYHSRSPIRQQRERVEGGDLRKHVKEDRPDVRDLLSDLQDISDGERKTSSAASSTAASGSGTEEETSSEESEEPEEEEDDDEEEDDEEEETESNSEAASEQTAVTESRFDHESEEEEEEEEEDDEEEIRIASPLLNVQTEGEFVPNSPVMTPLELKQELPKYLPALQGCRSVEEFQCLNRIEEGPMELCTGRRTKRQVSKAFFFVVLELQHAAISLVHKSEQTSSFCYFSFTRGPKFHVEFGNVR